MTTLRTISLIGLFTALSTLLGCGSPLVGLECRDGFERCGDECIELSSDEAHCGGCNIVCAAAEQCIASACVPGSVVPDGGTGDGGDLGDGGELVEAGPGTPDGSFDGEGGLPGDGGAGDGGPDDGLDGGRRDGGGLDGGRDGGGDGETDPVGGRDARVGGDAASGDMDSATLPGGGDAGNGTGGGDAGNGTGGGDAGNGTGGGGEDGGEGEPEPPPVQCSGPGSPPDCTCPFGTLECPGPICVDANTDRNNCGDCGVVCDVVDFCSNGDCRPRCEDPLTLCGDICVNLSTDDANCGACNSPCGPLAACIDMACVGRAVGHIVLLGHDMSAERRPMRVLVGNSVFLARLPLTRVIVYDANSTLASRVGVAAAIQTMSLELNRPYTIATVPADAVSLLLSTADVFVINVQQGASDEQLEQLGRDWSLALDRFLFRGGVIVMFDAGGTNAGTYQILEAATVSRPPAAPRSLLAVDGRTAIPRSILQLATPSDAVASGMPTEYQSEGESASFSFAAVDNPGVVVVRTRPDPDLPPEDQELLPVVIHSTLVD